MTKYRTVYRSILLSALAAASMIFLTATSHAITIDMVTVGNPGNAPDTDIMYDGTTGYGSVGYRYRIGKYEVTAGQYTEFLNAVAKDDPNELYSTDMASIPDAGANIQRTGSSPDYSYSVAADWADRPVNYVSFWDAARFANWLHNNQPTGPQGPGTTEDGAYLSRRRVRRACIITETSSAVGRASPNNGCLTWKWLFHDLSARQSSRPGSYSATRAIACRSLNVYSRKL